MTIPINNASCPIVKFWSIPDIDVPTAAAYCWLFPYNHCRLVGAKLSGHYLRESAHKCAAAITLGINPGKMHRICKNLRCVNLEHFKPVASVPVASGPLMDWIVMHRLERNRLNHAETRSIYGVSDETIHRAYMRSVIPLLLAIRQRYVDQNIPIPRKPSKPRAYQVNVEQGIQSTQLPDDFPSRRYREVRTNAILAPVLKSDRDGQEHMPDYAYGSTIEWPADYSPS